MEKNLKKNIYVYMCVCMCVCVCVWQLLLFFSRPYLVPGGWSLLSVITGVCICVCPCVCVLVQVCIRQRILDKVLPPSCLPTLEIPRSHGVGTTGAATPAFQFSAPYLITMFKNTNWFNDIITLHGETEADLTHFTRQDEIRNSSWGLSSHFCTITASQ